MKRFFGAMSGRIFVILVLGIVASAILTWWFASSERQRMIGQFRDSHTLDRIEHVVLALDSMTLDARGPFLQLVNRHGMRVQPWPKGEPVPSEPVLPVNVGNASANMATNASVNLSASVIGPDQAAFGRELAQRLGTGHPLQLLPVAAEHCQSRLHTNPFLGKPPPPLCLRLMLRLRDQTPMLISILPPRNPVPAPHLDWSPALLFLASVALLAYGVARMTMRPLADLAQAATNLGRDINQPPLPVRGAWEITQAIGAFNAMQARIRQHIAQRTQMLAAITHDLQTPLTRLRLRLEKVADPELRDKLIGDLSAMQGMVREGLDLARSIDSNETMQKLDIDSLLDSLCSDAVEAGQDVTLQGLAGCAILARPLSLRRCLVNLIDNAVKYGSVARVSIALAGNVVEILVRDSGPGLAPELLEQVFEPFFRVETSRSRESGGTGLGLTIARNIAEQHGGTLTLDNQAEGGLVACLRLPGP
jgi:signal transduction histidine kinase